MNMFLTDLTTSNQERFMIVHSLDMPILTMHLIGNSTCLRGAIQDHYGPLFFFFFFFFFFLLLLFVFFFFFFFFFLFFFFFVFFVFFVFCFLFFFFVIVFCFVYL